MQGDGAVAGGHCAEHPGRQRRGRRAAPPRGRPTPAATTATMPTPMLRVRSSSSCGHPADLRDQPEHRLRGPGRPVDGGRQVRRQHPGQVRRQPAAGDVAERVHLDAVAGRSAPGSRGRRSGSARAARRPAAGRARGPRGPAPSRPGVEQHVAHQRVAVGVQPAGDAIATSTSPVADPVRRRAAGRPRRHRSPAPATSYSSGPSSPGCSAVSPPTSAQPASTQPSAIPLTIAGDPLRHDLAAGDVVGHEQRLGAAHDQVVDDHADQVVADRVVPVGGRGDGHLGADAVGRGRQQRTPVRREQAGVEEPGEAADAADDLRPGRLRHPRLHQLDRAVARLDVDPAPRHSSPRRCAAVMGG